MMTKKDRKIANEQAKVKNRDILIKDMEEQAEVLCKENQQLRADKEELKDILQCILELTTSNTYNNDRVVLNKVKELASDYQSIC